MLEKHLGRKIGSRWHGLRLRCSHLICQVGRQSKTTAVSRFARPTQFCYGSSQRSRPWLPARQAIPHLSPTSSLPTASPPPPTCHTCTADSSSPYSNSDPSLCPFPHSRPPSAARQSSTHRAKPRRSKPTPHSRTSSACGRARTASSTPRPACRGTGAAVGDRWDRCSGGTPRRRAAGSGLRWRMARGRRGHVGCAGGWEGRGERGSGCGCCGGWERGDAGGRDGEGWRRQRRHRERRGGVLSHTPFWRQEWERWCDRAWSKGQVDWMRLMAARSLLVAISLESRMEDAWDSRKRGIKSITRRGSRGCKGTHEVCMSYFKCKCRKLIK